MKIIVCGGRDYNDHITGFEELDAFHKEHEITHVIHGAAKGADTIADEWAKLRNISSTSVPALWKVYGKSAGYKRNVKMADMKPDAVLAFPGGKGTQMMIDIARNRGIPVYLSNIPPIQPRL